MGASHEQGVQCVQKGGTPLVRDLVHDTLQNIVQTGNADDAASQVFPQFPVCCVHE